MTRTRPTPAVRTLGLLLATLLALLAGATGSAVGSSDQESTFQDDKLLVYGKPTGVAQTLDLLRSLGVDRVRVSVFWSLIAPAPTSKRRPAFDAANPAAYPPGAWDRYDRIVELAHQRGIGVNFNLTDPAPYWATGSPPRPDIEKTFQPSAREFGLFVRAVGTRYSGTYVPDPAPGASPAPPSPVLGAPTPSGGPGPAGPGGPPVPPAPAAATPRPARPSTRTPRPTPSPARPSTRTPRTTPQTAAAVPPGTAIPAVDYWAIWNEPNQAGWLTPQWIPDPHRHGRFVENAPAQYRALVDAATLGLLSTHHANDTILVGETAPKGLNVQGTTRSIKALRFIRMLYCLDDHLHPLRGNAARDRACPTTGAGTSRFAQDHPGLFYATGFAHHPYELTFAPHRAPTDPDFATIANLPRLSSILARILRIYGVSRMGALPLYLTEFGYQTDPPDPLGVTPAQQVTYLNEAEFIAYNNPAVRTLSQFLLVDEKPKAGARNRVAAYGATFQSGLLYDNGRTKPSYANYPLPIYIPIPRARRRHPIRVWGLLRAAPRNSPQRVAVQMSPGGRHAHWRTIATVTTRGPRGYVDARVRPPGSGLVRLRWTNPASGRSLHSTAVAVRVSR
ncbi:MAG TPA: hypothetical protein VGN69_11190 [Solirubrobacteraceae bacterium]|nr:hypothetical protein [Solirubrobacteraceae bacterium]